MNKLTYYAVLWAVLLALVIGMVYFGLAQAHPWLPLDAVSEFKMWQAPEWIRLGCWNRTDCWT